MLDASMWEVQLDAVNRLLEREVALAAGTAEVAKQVKAVTDAWFATRQASEGASGEAGGTAMQAAGVDSLKASLSELEATYGKNSIAANKLRADIAGMDSALAKNEAAAQGLSDSLGDGVAYTVQLAAQSYGSYEEALNELGKTTIITVPLLAALQKAFGIDPGKQAALNERLKETEKAIKAVQFALGQERPAA